MKLRWWDALSIAFAAWASAFCGDLHGQQSLCNEHLPVCPAIDTVHLDSAFVQAQWDYVLGCTGLTPQFGGDLGDVVFRLYPPHTLVSHQGHLMGQWVTPDTVDLDITYLQNPWVLRHELLHHLLRGPPNDQGGPHPYVPFMFPCHVMPAEHLGSQ